MLVDGILISIYLVTLGACVSSQDRKLQMASSSFVGFPGNLVGLIVRGKENHAHEPGLMEQHADCILSNGAPVGFYGEGNDGSSNSSGLGMQGIVYDFAQMQRKRRPYVDASSARGSKMLSTYLLVLVSAGEAKKFDDAWGVMTKSPGSFNILGGNCSTHASRAFQAAGILSGGIPGLDTPNNLYKQLCVEKKGKLYGGSGYLGFAKMSSGGFQLEVGLP
jgi:hypothetical protein